MRSIFKTSVLVISIALASLISLSAQSTLETGLIADWPDISHQWTLPTTVGGQTDRFAPWLDPYISYVYTAKLDDANKLKIGLYVENFFIFGQGVAPLAT